MTADAPAPSLAEQIAACEKQAARHDSTADGLTGMYETGALRKMARNLRAAAATLREAEWRGIETAPKDGSWFMIVREQEGLESCEIGRWEPHFWPRYVEVEGGLFRKEQEQLSEWSRFNNFHRATHWRPLPRGPAA